MEFEIETGRKKPGNIAFIVPGGESVEASVHDGVVLLPKGFTRSDEKRPRGKRVPRGKTTSAIKIVRLSKGYSPDAVTNRVVEVLGNNTVATLLGVNKDRPSRWVAGTDAPTAENRSRLTDLDSLVGHLLSVFTPDQAVLWLNGQDPFLGARPLDVYQLEGAAPVIDAMRAHEQGAYA